MKKKKKQRKEKEHILQDNDSESIMKLETNI